MKYNANNKKNDITKPVLIGLGIGLLATIGYLVFRNKNKLKQIFINYYGNPGRLDKSHPMGIRNNNPGNIRITNTAWQGKVPMEENTDGQFEQFYNFTDGLRAMIKNIQTLHRRGFDNIKDLLNVYAPPTENDTDAYIEAVSDSSGIRKGKTFDAGDDETMYKIVSAMAAHENGGYYVNRNLFNQAWSKV